MAFCHILKDLNALVEDRDWEAEVLPLVAEMGQGKGVARVPEDLWDKHRGWEENNQPAGWHTAV
jgi:hypothetical protein